MRSTTVILCILKFCLCLGRIFYVTICLSYLIQHGSLLTILYLLIFVGLKNNQCYTFLIFDPLNHLVAADFCWSEEHSMLYPHFLSFSWSWCYTFLFDVTAVIFAELIKRTGKDTQGLSLILSVIRAFATRGELDIAKRLNVSLIRFCWFNFSFLFDGGNKWPGTASFLKQRIFKLLHFIISVESHMHSNCWQAKPHVNVLHRLI